MAFFVIRNQQLDALRQASVDNFKERILTYLRGAYAERCSNLSEQDLRGFIERALAAAKENGIETEGSVIVLTGLLFEFGEKFEHSADDAKALEILADTSLAGPTKVTRLEQCLVASTGGRTISHVPHPT